MQPDGAPVFLADPARATARRDIRGQDAFEGVPCAVDAMPSMVDVILPARSTRYPRFCEGALRGGSRPPDCARPLPAPSKPGMVVDVPPSSGSLTTVTVVVEAPVRRR
ncbi:hypothetical protein K523DRAFT_326650 [Schizophyllum commune Tattone D]|nr:hypothetical protein K523DRAFT_326650 [Schizophyllum commune Tattone D]